MTTSDRIPLSQVRDVLHIGHPLPFRVLDAQRRLLLNEGQVLLDEVQFDVLIERGAWVERSLVDAARKARAAVEQPPIVAQISLFDRWERLLWQFDKLSRGLVRRGESGSAIVPFFAALRALVDRDPDVALFLCARHEDRRFALYPLQHSIHCSILVLMTSRQLGWPAVKCTSLGCAALTMNLTMLELQASIHPPGSLVKLNSGEIGVSIRRPATGTHPLVATLSDRTGHPSGTTHRRDTAQPEFGVEGPLQDATAFSRVPPERVYGPISS